MNEIKIVVSGQAMSGKSTIAEIISQALADKGFTVEKFDDTSEVKIKSTLEKRITSIQSNPHKVSIDAVQTLRV